MFKRRIRELSKEFFEEYFRKKVRIIAHHDADGISSAAMMLEAMENSDISYHISIFKQIRERNLKYLGRGYDAYLFLDLGSRLAKKIKEFVGDKEVYILDHHPADDYPEDVNIINPFMFGINGDEEISSSGITYLFAKDHINKTKYLSLVGAFGDVQIDGDPKGLNSEILNELILDDVVEVRYGLKVFGRTYKPINSAIASSIDPYIPLNDTDIISILKRAKIEYKIGDYMKTISDLTEEEERELISYLIIEMINRKVNFDPKSLIGKIYLRKGYKGMLSDLREIATIINAFGRTNKYSLILLILLGKNDEKPIVSVLEEYRKEIATILEKIKRGEIIVDDFNGIKVIRGENSIREEIVGTVTSILSNVEDGRLFVGIGYSEDDYLKVSLRSSEMNCEEVARYVCEKINCEGGGHERAAGVELRKDQLEDFLKIIKEL